MLGLCLAANAVYKARRVDRFGRMAHIEVVRSRVWVARIVSVVFEANRRVPRILFVGTGDRLDPTERVVRIRRHLVVGVSPAGDLPGAPVECGGRLQSVAIRHLADNGVAVVVVDIVDRGPLIAGAGVLRRHARARIFDVVVVAPRVIVQPRLYEIVRTSPEELPLVCDGAVVTQCGRAVPVAEDLASRIRNRDVGRQTGPRGATGAAVGRPDWIA